MGTHVGIAMIGVSVAFVAVVPIGIWTARSRAAGIAEMFATGIATVPALALLGLLAAGGARNVSLWLVALCAAPSLLRGAISATRAVSDELQEVSEALALRRGFRLRHIDVPLGLPWLLRGARDASVAAIAAATLSAVADESGCGALIVRGLREGDEQTVVLGTAAATLLAFAARLVFGAAVRIATPRALRHAPLPAASTQH
jgi:osmoprotectant transport system permease protein